MESVCWADRNKGLLAEINDTIWKFAETGLLEKKSSEYLISILEGFGFSVEKGAAGMDTAFIARFGTEGPEIGFLAEYDALPELSQKVSPVMEKEETCPDSGHGCGHNSLAAAIIGGALGIRQEIENGNVKGRVTVFGCPAEELLIGKVKMAAEHLFDSCAVLLSCHPNDVSYVWARTSNAVWSGRFTFHGKTAHAAIDPFNGRSALDAVELMNVGANFLREHVTQDVRIHYVITDGGKVPNVVPATAKVWYTVRARDLRGVLELRDRVRRLAEGAAVMTETSWEENCVSCCSDVLRNRVLERILLDVMKETGAPEWSEEDYEFAEAISSGLSEEKIKNAVLNYGLSEKDWKRGLHTGIYDGLYREGEVMAVSTDVGDASWQVPTGVFSFASTVVGSPGHSWFYTACCGSSIAHKGVCMAAKVLEETARRLLDSPDLIREARDSFIKEKNGREHQCVNIGTRTI